MVIARLAVVVGLALAACGSASAGLAPEKAKRVVLDAMAASQGGIPGQAEALVALAWLDQNIDPAVRKEARDQLAEFGGNALESLMFAMDKVSPEQTAEVVDVVLRAHSSFTGPVHQSFEPALVAAIWVGSREAKQLAIPELTLRRNRHAVLPLIDSAIEDPALVQDVVRALGGIGDDRARFYLEQILNGDDLGLAQDAAVSLARIGGKAITVLHPALRSPHRELRLMAARALVPTATESDLSALYEYLVSHPDDDPQLTEVVRQTTMVIEAGIEARRAAEAASAIEDF